MFQVRKLLVVAMALIAPAAFATGADFSSLTSAVDFSSASTAILLVFAAIAGVAIVMKGGGAVLRALGFK